MSRVLRESSAHVSEHNAHAAGGGLPRASTQAELVSRLEHPRWPIVLAVADLCALVLTLVVVSALREFEPFAPDVWTLWLFIPLTMALLVTRRMYTRSSVTSKLDSVGHVTGATALAALVVLAIGLEVGNRPSVGTVEWLWVLGAGFVGTARFVLALVRRSALRRGRVGTPTLIVGSGPLATRLERRLKDIPETGLVPIGFVDDEPVPLDEVPDREGPIWGHPADLPDIVASSGARHVILTFVGGGDAVLLPLVRMCERLDVGVSIVPRLFELTTERLYLERIGPLPVYELRHVDPEGWQFQLKYGFERVFAAALLIAFAPAFTLTALAVKLTSSGPVFFRQRRIGRDGSEFELLKFRSMRISDPGQGMEAVFESSATLAPGGVEGSDRRTPIGRFLRSTSLDELPQLINVARGEMALVGPRPERPEYVEVFGQHIHRYTDRHRVKSGITGWAQVHRLRGKTSIEERADMDNWYIENWSPLLDLRILLMTIGAVLHRAE